MRTIATLTAVLLLSAVNSAQHPPHPAEIAQRIAGLEKKVADALANYSEIKEINRLKDQLGPHILVTVYLPEMGISMHSSGANSSKTNAVLKDPAHLELVFFPAAALNTSRIHNTLSFYDSEWHALFLYEGFRDPAWMDFGILTGLYYADGMRRGEPPLREPSLQYQYKLRLKAELLGSQVLNLATKQRYEPFCRNLIANLQASSLDQFLQAFKVYRTPLISGIDKAFFTPATRAGEAESRAVQYTTCVLKSWTDEHFPPAQRQQVMLDGYQKLFTVHYDR